jgi:hypothetical protein
LGREKKRYKKGGVIFFSCCIKLKPLFIAYLFRIKWIGKWLVKEDLIGIKVESAFFILLAEGFVIFKLHYFISKLSLSLTIFYSFRLILLFDCLNDV